MEVPLQDITLEAVMRQNETDKLCYSIPQLQVGIALIRTGHCFKTENIEGRNLGRPDDATDDAASHAQHTAVPVSSLPASVCI